MIRSNNRRVALSLALAAIAALFLADCATRRQPAPRPSPVTVLPSALAADRYMSIAASSALYAIRASEMALERSRSGALRDFAQSQIADQRGISGQLAFAGRRLNSLPSAMLLPLHQSMLDQLAASADFDALYRRQQARVTGEALALHRAFAIRGASPTLRPVATMAAPILAREVARLNAL